MAQVSLEQRVKILERQVADLERRLAADSPDKDWRTTIGMFAEDELMQQVFEEARKIREADRRRARRNPSRHQGATPRRVKR